MSFKDDFAEAWEHGTILAGSIVGGLLGLIVIGVQGGWLPLPIGVLLGVCVALWFLYSKVRAEREAARLEVTALRSAGEGVVGGIDFRVSEMLVHAKIEGLDGVMIAVAIDRLVNRNNFPVSLEIVLRAPLPLGGIPVNVGVGPETEPVSYVSAKSQLLSSPIDVPAKSNLGYRYMLFNFRKTKLAPAPFQNLWKGSDEELAQAIERSEMYFEVTDVANDQSTERFDAPGTWEKKHQRLEAQKKKKKESQ